MIVPAEIKEAVVRRFGDVDATFESFAHNETLTDGVWRVRAGNDSVIVKRLRPPDAAGDTPWARHWTERSTEPRHWNYWNREAQAYESGIVAVFEADGIRAPDCIAVERHPQGVDLWLEDVQGVPGETWDLPSYARAAEALGAGQARVSGLESGPSFPCLSQNFLEDYSREKPVDWTLLHSDPAWNHHLVRDHFPAELRGAASMLHESRDALYALTARLPRMLSHLDFWSKNLIETPSGIVAIDWAFVGDGAIGEDVGNLILDAVFDHFVDAALLPELEVAVFDGYLAGLRRGGWTGDERVARLGMHASAIKYDWLTPFMLARATADRQMAYGGMVEVDAAHRFAQRGAALLHATGWAEQALAAARHLDG